MKTPREILLKRHRDAQPELDVIRRAVVANETQSATSRLSLSDLLRSLRWHLAGMSIVWLFVLILHADTGRAPMLAAAMPKPLPPQVMLASVREHRRLLSEMADARPAAAEVRELFLPRPHSEWRPGFLIG